MAVTNTKNKQIFSAIGGTTYTVTFDFLEDEDNLVVYYENTLGEPTLLVLTADYTVDESTGIITTVSTYTSGKIVVVRDVPETQAFDVTTGDGFRPDDLEHQLDQTVMTVQQISRRVEDSFKLADSDTTGASPELPTPAPLTYLRWDSDGTALEAVDETDIGTSVQASNFIVNSYDDGVDFTAGVTTELALSSPPGAIQNTQVYFDGVYIPKEDYSLLSSTITFDVAIPGGTSKVEVMVIEAAEPTAIDTADSIQFNTSPPAVTPTTGLVWWDEDNQTHAFGLPGGSILQNGYETLARVVNKTGATLLNGTVVYVNGAQGNRPTIAKAQADSLATSTVIGICTQDINNNSEGAVALIGELRDVDTSSFSEGDIVYLSASTAGEFTNVAPTSPNYRIKLGVVTTAHATVGKLQLRICPPLAMDATMAADSDDVAPTQKAVKTHVATAVGRIQYIHGLVLSNGTDQINDIDISAGSCMDDGGNNVDITLGATTIALDASGAGGLDTGLKADGNWYYVWAIAKADGTVSALFSLSASAPTMPSGYVYKRRLGAAYYIDGTDGVREFYQVGDEFFWESPSQDLALVSVTLTTREDHTLLVPPSSLAIVSYLANEATTGTSTYYSRISNPDIADVATTSANATLTFNTYASSGTSVLHNGRHLADASSQVSTRWDAVPGADKYKHEIRTLGWVDRRGQDG